MGKRYTDADKALAKELYIKNMPLSLIAKQVGCTVRTLENWKDKAKTKGDDWAAIKDDRNHSKDRLTTSSNKILLDVAEVVEETMTQLRENPDIPAVEKAEILAKISDSYSKLSKAIKDTSPKVNQLAILRDILAWQEEYIKEKHPELLQGFALMLAPFAKLAAQKLTKKA